MDTDTKDKKKKEFLKTLPIWAPFDKIDVEIALLEHDIDTLSQQMQEYERRFEQLPKLPLDGRPIITSGGYVRDKVKLYKKNDNGEIIVRDQPKEQINHAQNSSMEMLKAKPSVGEEVFAMQDVGQPWVECKIVAVYRRSANGRIVTLFKLKKVPDAGTIRVGKFCVARVQNHKCDLRVPKRVIAGPDKSNMLPGIIGQDACIENRNRYLVLLDNGSAQYFKPEQVYPIIYQSPMPWQDFKQLGIHNENLLAELTQFFKNYPKRILVETSLGRQMEVMRNGVYVPAMVIGFDCDIMTIAYKDRSQECLYRGSPRLIKRAGIVSRLLVNDISFEHLAPRLVGNLHRYHEAGKTAIQDDYLNLMTGIMGKMSLCGNYARKSTSRTAPPKIKVSSDSTGPVADDRRSIPELSELTRTARAAHKCTPACISQPDKRTEESVVDLIDEFRDVSDLKVPLKLGWSRLLVTSAKSQRVKQIIYIYEAPCGKIFCRICDIRRYLQIIKSRLDVDFFSFDREVDLNRDIGDRMAYYHEKNIALPKKGVKPLENKFVSLINWFNKERLPVDFEYSNETFPHPMLKTKGFSFNEDFKSGCDCEDDCMSKANCACHQLNEEAAGPKARHRCQYKDKRLLQQVNTGIFECNGFCSCSSKCGNRVVQNGLRIRLQVRKTLDKGWGVYTLDDVPKGSFICTYSAELLDDADQYGDSDMYFADLDYITVVENEKISREEEENGDEGVGLPGDDDDDSDDLSQNGTKKRRYHRIQETDSESDGGSMLEPDVNGIVSAEFMPRDTERQRAESHERSSGFRRIHSILDVSQDYTLDARMQGNIGRFFNHSCDPNAFVQNVFIESHDLRFPTVAFFTKRSLKADDEITWHYNYQIGSIEGRQINCNCGAPNCAGRIL